jgi:hypothetical protein
MADTNTKEKPKHVPVKYAYYEGTQRVQAILYADGTILVNDIRFSYPHIGKPFESTDDNGNKKSRYSLKGMLPKATHKPTMLLIKRFMEEMMAKHQTSDLASDRKFIRNGDDLGKPEMKGHWVISASEDTPPSARDAAALKIGPDEANRLFYGGCWGNALIRPWWQNHAKYGKRINSGLSAVQFVKDDEPFGEGRISDEDVDNTFSPVEGASSGFDADDDLDDL